MRRTRGRRFNAGYQFPRTHAATLSRGKPIREARLPNGAVVRIVPLDGGRARRFDVCAEHTDREGNMMTSTCLADDGLRGRRGVPPPGEHPLAMTFSIQVVPGFQRLNGDQRDALLSLAEAGLLESPVTVQVRHVKRYLAVDRSGRGFVLHRDGSTEPVKGKTNGQ